MRLHVLARVRPLVFGSLVLAVTASASPRPTATLALPPGAAADTSKPIVRGNVADPSGAIVPNAEIQLLDASGKAAATLKSDGEGNFQLPTLNAGTYTLVVSEAGFDTVKTRIILGKQLKASPTLHIVLPISATATTVDVNAEQDVDLTDPATNADTSVMNAADLKALPIFDNDFATAMSAFMDTGSEGTGGAGLIVDGVEANRSSVSASAVQEVRINQDPYSAQYYYPGRGQMEIITKSATEQYHGEANFIFRDSALNARNALAATKPYEQRRIYEGNVTGPLPRLKNSGFLVSFNRAEEDQDAVVIATLSDTGTAGLFQDNVAAPTRETDFSTRLSHQFGDKHSAYAQYSFYNWNGNAQGVGGQTLATAGFNVHYHGDDFVAHVDSTLSPVILNQASIVLEHETSSDANTAEAPQVVVSGDFVGGSAQNDNHATEYNGRLTDMVTWNYGHHTIKAGIGIPHFSRRVFDDDTNELGTYTFAPTTAADGTVTATALQNYAGGDPASWRPSNFTQNGGQSRFVYHQQEMGAFVQDQWKISDTLSLTPGLRYDWQNFLATKRLAFSPRLSFAWLLDKNSKTVLRGGGGLYYDRFGSGPLLDLARYEDGQRRSVNLSLDPASAALPACIAANDCYLSAPPNLVRNAATHIPYQIQYGLSLERAFGKNATGTISAYTSRGADRYRSIDVNAPTPESDYTVRPDPAIGRIRVMSPEGTYEGSGFDVSFRGTLNKYFTGFGRYTWSHYENNQEGINFYPQNQYDPNAEWASTSWDRRHRLGMYAMFNRESVLNLGVGIFANSGTPWTILTGTDPYGDGLFNARPEGVARNTENLPNYYDLDLRWGHDWHVTDNKDEQAPRLGFSAGAYNLLNHENVTGVDQVETSSTFAQPTVAAPARRIQVAMRFEF